MALSVDDKGRLIGARLAVAQDARGVILEDKLLERRRYSIAATGAGSNLAVTATIADS